MPQQSDTPALTRAISFRQDFSALFNRAMNSAAGTGVVLGIDERFVPFFLRGRSLNLRTALLLVKPAARLTSGDFSVTLNGTGLTGFAEASRFPGYHEANVQGALAVA